jgi:ABC-type Fe3+/spermidine/putrescine transport system ATPase subunit
VSKVTGLVKDYGDFNLQIPEMQIADEGVTCLIGPSGSGKSSVFRILTGIEDCQSLSWRYKDLDLAKLPVRERQLGVVFQSYEIFPHMTTEKNIFFAAQVRDLGHQVAKSSLNKLINKLELESCRSTLGRNLSGGEQQRVAIARALIGQPRFLLLDEPFSSLDVPLRKKARELLLQLINEQQVPTLLVTHDPEDVEAMATQKVFIEKGQIKSS